MAIPILILIRNCQLLGKGLRLKVSSNRLEKPVIELATPGLHSGWFIQYMHTTAAPTIMINLYKHSVLLWNIGNGTGPDQTPKNAASEQGLHCLLTKCSIKI